MWYTSAKRQAEDMARRKALMEPNSVTRKRKMCWRNLWQLVFLAASIMSSSFFLSEVQGGPIYLGVSLNPDPPKIGEDLLLKLAFPEPNLVSCYWLRGDSFFPGRLIFSYYFQPIQTSINGPAFTGRESTGRDCHLLIKNLRREDIGLYEMHVNRSFHDYAFSVIQIRIPGVLPVPFLETSPSNGIVAENSNASLLCHNSLSDLEVSWSKDGEPLPPLIGQFSSWKRILTLFHVAKNHTGTYRCMVKDLNSRSESNLVQILVSYGPEIKLNPVGTIYQSLHSELVVECIADSVPEATLEWFFNGIKQKETGSVFKVLLKDTNYTGSYTCQATNSYTNHTDKRSCYVIVTKGGLSPGAIAGIVIGSVAGVALASGLLVFLLKTFCRV